jgi:tetratricopeptide (TPR) repeat protein
MRALVLLGLVAVSSLSSAQFVFPKGSYHDGDPQAYKEDPFVSHYRGEFFAVFKGDIPRFRKAFAEVAAMVKKDPKNAEALVWYGNGQMIEAGLSLFTGKRPEAETYWKSSQANLDKAVKLDPNNYNIYVVRTATLIVGAEKYPKEWVSRGVWEHIRDDCAHFIKYMGPDRLAKTSIHMKGEIYGCLGLAYAHLGDKPKAREAFDTVIKLDPGTDYEVRAKKELAGLG